MKNDYEVVHDSGRKVRKTSDSEIETLSSSFKNISSMASINKFKSTEKEIVEEIKDCILLNDLPSIDDIDMINEYIEELTRFHRRYPSIHAELKEALGIDEYVEVYQNFDNVSDDVIAEVKKARSAKSRVKREGLERSRRQRKKLEKKG